MAQKIGVARAAQMLGVSRRELQKLIHAGKLDTFEGELDLDSLKQRFPALSMEENSTIERMKLIRGGAFARRVAQVVVPERDELEVQLRRRTTDLIVERAKAKKYYAILEEMMPLCTQLCAREELNKQQAFEILNQWLIEKLQG